MADYIEDSNESLNIDDPKIWVMYAMIEIAEDIGFTATKSRGFFSKILGAVGLGYDKIELHKVEDSSYMKDDQELGVCYSLGAYPFSLRETKDKVIQKFHEINQEFSKYNQKSNLESLVYSVYYNFSTYITYEKNIESKNETKINNVLNMSYDDILSNNI